MDGVPNDPDPKSPPVPPKTIVVDLPLSDESFRLFMAGGLIAVFGLIVRVCARRLAWPTDWSYSGDRANTGWAFAEAVYIDLSLFALAFGLGLIFLGIVRVTQQSDRKGVGSG